MSVTPDFVGQIYKDTTTGNLWRANSTTPGDWTLELIDNKQRWQPTSFSVPDQLGFSCNPISGNDVLTGATSLVLLNTTIMYIEIVECNTLTSISSATLTSIFDANQSYLSIQISSSSIQSISFPALASSIGPINLSSNTQMTSCDLSSLVSVDVPSPDIAITISNCPLLTSIDLSSFVPLNGAIFRFQTNALTAACVNSILARLVANAGYVSGSVNLEGGSNSAPTGQGVTDKNTLIARGVGVTTN